MSEKKNILITGASGFIGGHVARYFAEKGEQVTCLLRPGSDTSFIDDIQMTRVAGDILDIESLEKAFKGMDFIIHIAARVGDWGKYEDFYNTNVQGTLNVLNAALHNNIRDVILTGTVSSYGEENCKSPKDETNPYRSHYPYFLDRIFPSAMNYYRDTKALMTTESIDFARKNNMNLTIIEPVWVYGENEFSSGFYEYLKAVSSGMPFMPGSKKNLFHVVYAGDLAEAFYLACKKNLNGIHRIIIGNEKPELMNQLYKNFCLAANLKMPRNLPKCLVYPVGFILELISTVLNKTSPPILTRARVDMFYDNIAYRTDNAYELLSFRCKTDIVSGINNTVTWYIQHKYL
jgi:nucleoside-diphosphate-sugar epimerase